MENFEKIFLAQLLNKKFKNFIRLVLPCTKIEYFSNDVYKEIFIEIYKYVKKYKKIPPIYLIQNKIQDIPKLHNKIFEDVIVEFFNEVPALQETEFDEKWLIDESEKFLKERSLYNAILSAVDDIEKNKISISSNVIQNLQKSLGFSFDKSIGIELTSEENVEKRFKVYREKIEHFSTGLSKLDMLTSGGYERKSLSLVLASTGVGKTNFLISTASQMLRTGKNVLYITLEMSEEKIAQRFDANFLQIPINDIPNLEENKYVQNIKNKLIHLSGRGRLIIKEFPPVFISTMNLYNLLDELKFKENFVPDILIIDYLSLMKSDRIMKFENSYTLGKSISEEVRGLAIEKNISVVSAVQTNRSGVKSSNIEMDAISESFGVVFTADFVGSLIMTEELRQQNIQLVKLLKNRFGNIVDFTFPVKVDFETATVSDLNNDDGSFTNGINSTKTEELVKKIQSKESIITKEIDIDDDFDDDF